MILENGGITTSATNPSDIVSLKRRGWKEVVEVPVEAEKPAEEPKKASEPKPKKASEPKAVKDV